MSLANSTGQVISRSDLEKLVAELMATGAVVIAPQWIDNKPYLRPIDKPDRMVLDGQIKTINTVKEYFFPRHEVLFHFERNGNDVRLTDVEPFNKEQIIIGSRPCEAMSLEVLDPLFSWDYQDRFYQSRRGKSLLISIACQTADRHCFCQALGSSPEDSRGSDAMLFPLEGDLFEVRTITNEGKMFFEGKTHESDQTGGACSLDQPVYNMKAISQWIKDNFDSSFWDDETLRCLGCGVCTYLCPTCHCFDIVDEGSYKKGERVKNWDTCQSALFTLHASGHNPRSRQGQRQRQRIMHKFSVYPEKFSTLLCTGCGNCTRYCLTTLGIQPMLDKIVRQINLKDKE